MITEKQIVRESKILHNIDFSKLVTCPFLFSGSGLRD